MNIISTDLTEKKVTAIQKKMAVILRGYGLRLECNWESLAEDLAKLGEGIKEVELCFLDPQDHRKLLSYLFDFHQLENHGELLIIPIQERVLVPQLRVRCHIGEKVNFSMRWVSMHDNGFIPSGYDVVPNGNGRIVIHHCLRCRGVIMKYPVNGKFGFISTGGSGIFFLRSWVEGRVEVGDEVSFVPAICHLGAQAHRVRRINGA